MLQNIKRYKRFVLGGIILLYIAIGHLPFWYRIGVHVVTQGNWVYGDTLPIDFNWFALNTMFWLHFTLFLLTVIAIQLSIRGDVWKRIVIGQVLFIIAIVPLGNSFMQSSLVSGLPIHAPRMNVSECPEISIFIKDRLIRVPDHVYVSSDQGLTLHNVGNALCAGNECKVRLFEKSIRPLSSLTSSDIRQCIHTKHKVSTQIQRLHYNDR